MGGIGASPTPRQSSTNNPEQRLARFKKLYEQHLVGFSLSPDAAGLSMLTVAKQHARYASSNALDAPTAELIRVTLERLTTILHEESRSPIPHRCLAFASSAKIYVTISRVASESRNEGLIREAITTFGTLIDSEEEDFLSDAAFSSTLMSFVSQVSGSNSFMFGPETEAEVVELLFGIAAKIRLQPDILPMWFTASSTREDAVAPHSSRPEKRNSFEGVTHKDDFPLLYLLLNYMHHEGRVGDFARTGLLYIIESASSSRELERWLVESDLATLMASGLGALYSQLSRSVQPGAVSRLF